MKRFWIATLLAVLALPATAAAKDQDVYDAYEYSYPVSFHKATEAYDRWEKRVTKTKLRDARAPRKAAAASRFLSRVLKVTGVEVARAKPSSELGGVAKSLALRSLRSWRKGLAAEAAGLDASRHG